ncbi:hypothetical protein [Magnetospirillum molischianum]|uniref:C2H2-type domain-containing protein n=1 Tax=Magnetospirillum molischianum DSM 120 TaxID=1150626 RepID=H8FYE8_MAGML|nr:hypothetical protein [Magnetospirillum molischianum]CCG43214.1 hypothetical protein PHAMO_80005 [Magnetospirillum molischianum DSM 120]CCG43386.1 hypothetical protein PHAMO_80177 [Magnetospirillum molischianum DSM 120]
MRKPPVNMDPWRKNKDEIMAIALRKGWFSVPKYLWRAEGMAKKCRELVKEGKLRRRRSWEKGRYSHDIMYEPVGVKVAPKPESKRPCHCPRCGVDCGDHDSYLTHWREHHDVPPAKPAAVGQN